MLGCLIFVLILDIVVLTVLVDDVMGTIVVGTVTAVLVIVYLWVRFHRPPGLRLLTRLQLARAHARTGPGGWSVPAQLIYAGPPRNRSRRRRSEGTFPGEPADSTLTGPVAQRLAEIVPGRIYLVAGGLYVHIWRRRWGLFLTRIASLRILDENITVRSEDPDDLGRGSCDQVSIWYQVDTNFGLSLQLPRGWLLPWQH